MTENPYLAMEDKVLDEHFKQVAEVAKNKGIDLLQFFGEMLSDDTKTIVSEHASLSKENEGLKEELASVGKINPDTEKLANITIGSLTSEISEIDSTIDASSIIAKVVDPFQKISVLEGVKGIALENQKGLEALKAQITKQPGVQGYSEPTGAADEADSIVEKLIANSGVKVD